MPGRLSRRYRRPETAGGGGSVPTARSICTVPKPPPMNVWNRPGVSPSPFAMGVSSLTVRCLDDVATGGDQLVGRQHQTAVGGLGSLLAGADVGLIHPQDVHELDSGDRVDDPEQLALVERTSQRPALGWPCRRAPDQRIEVDVERVGDVVLDALE